jgi:rRNA pseudouridine-1189 N-methylase Emg1 (Nep1/Mra1 family)
MALVNEGKKKGNNGDTDDRLSNLLAGLEIKKEHDQKLTSLDIEGIAEYIPKCKKIIFMTGAGISTCK